MGCSFSGLNALYDAMNGGADVWINENRFRIVKQIGEGGFAYVFLVKEIVSEGSGGGLATQKMRNSYHISGPFLSYSSFSAFFRVLNFDGFL